MDKTKKKFFISIEDEPGQVFKNPWLEKLTRTHISIPVGMFFLYAAGLIWYTKVATDLSNTLIIALFFGGWFLFTFAEYVIHRYAYHPPEEYELSSKIAQTIHGVHHDYPKSKKRLALPPLLTVVVGTILLFLFELILDKYSFSSLAGFMVGYAFYLLVHYAVHIFRPPNNFLKKLWANHAIHHYSNNEILYGVSSPLWDYIFRTLPNTKDKDRVKIYVKEGEPV